MKRLPSTDHSFRLEIEAPEGTTVRWQWGNALGGWTTLPDPLPPRSTYQFLERGALAPPVPPVPAPLPEISVTARAYSEGSCRIIFQKPQSLSGTLRIVALSAPIAFWEGQTDGTWRVTPLPEPGAALLAAAGAAGALPGRRRRGWHMDCPCRSDGGK